VKTIITEQRSNLKRRGDGSVTSARIKGDSNFIRSLQTSADPKQTVWQLLPNPIAYPYRLWPPSWDTLATSDFNRDSPTRRSGVSRRNCACLREESRARTNFPGRTRENAQLASTASPGNVLRNSYDRTCFGQRSQLQPAKCARDRNVFFFFLIKRSKSPDISSRTSLISITIPGPIPICNFH